MNPTKKKNFRTIKVNLILEKDKNANGNGPNLNRDNYMDKDYEVIESNPNFTIIGHMTNAADGTYYIDKSGSAITLKAQGWKQF